MQKRTQFTLVELIVIVAIMGIMATLLVQVVAIGKHKVAQKQCEDNIRGVHTFMATYIGDNRGMYPRQVNSVSWDDYLI